MAEMSSAAWRGKGESLDMTIPVAGSDRLIDHALPHLNQSKNVAFATQPFAERVGQEGERPVGPGRNPRIDAPDAPH